jgi:hypothetical protein
MFFPLVWKYNYGYFLKYFLFKNVLFFLFFKNYFYVKNINLKQKKNYFFKKTLLKYKNKQYTQKRWFILCWSVPLFYYSFFLPSATVLFSWRLKKGQ